MSTIHKGSVAAVRRPGVGRRIAFTFSTKDYDRESDRILGPWRLDAFKRNAVAMFAHDYKSLPLGRCVSVGMVGDELVGTIEFASAALNPQAESVYQMLCAGLLNSCSVGFRPLAEPKSNSKGGLDYGEVELMEISVCPLPANPDALARALGGSASSSVSEEALQRRVATIAATIAVASEEGAESLRRELSKLNLSDAEYDAFMGAIAEVL